MKDNFTRIAVVLDRSGSMASVREATIAGFNEFVREQQRLPGEAWLSLLQFDDQFETVIDCQIADVPLLTAQTFVPRGSTALLDAQGRTIVGLGAELLSLPENERASKVIVVTITDGDENASKEFSHAQIVQMIGEQREKYGWEFTYIGANQDAVKVAVSLGMAAGSAITYVANSVATGNVFRSVSSSIGNTCMTGQSINYSDADRMAARVDDAPGT